MPIKKRNWIEMKREYVEGINVDGKLTFPDLSQIAQKHDCTYSAISKKSSAEKWTTEKKLFWKKIEKSRQDKTIEHLASESANFNAKLLKLSEIFLSHCAKHAQEYQKEGKPMPAVELNRLSQVIERMGRTGNIALGENISEDTESPLKTLANKLIDKMSNEPPIN